MRKYSFRVPDDAASVSVLANAVEARHYPDGASSGVSSFVAENPILCLRIPYPLA
jgi:hypothetical protein